MINLSRGPTFCRWTAEGDPTHEPAISKSPIGLDGVPAAETVLSHVDGERGELIIAGEHVGDLVRQTGFEGVTARLWSGGTGKPLSEANVRASLGAARERAFARLPGPAWATRGLSIVDGSAPPLPDCARKTGCRMRPPSSAHCR